MSATATPALVRPGDPGWDEARRAWNLTVDQRPAAVAFASSAAEVAAITAQAAEEGLAVVPQCTGHGAAAVGPLGGAVLLRTAGLGGLEIDPQRRVARVGAGVLWGELQRAAAAHGLCGLAGTAPHVGVVGSTLGGGLGWLGRAHGLASSTVRDVEAEHGVVTAMALELLPVARVSAGVLRWPAVRGAELLDAWVAWTNELPPEMTSIARLIPGEALVELCHLGSIEEAGALLAPLLARVPGATGELEPMTPVELLALHRDPLAPAPAATAHGVVDEISIDALVAAFEGLVSLEVRHLGGALAGELPGRFLVLGVGIVAGPGAARASAAIGAVRAALGPGRRIYANFAADPAERAVALPHR